MRESIWILNPTYVAHTLQYPKSVTHTLFEISFALFQTLIFPHYIVNKIKSFSYNIVFFFNICIEKQCYYCESAFIIHIILFFYFVKYAIISKYFYYICEISKHRRFISYIQYTLLKVTFFYTLHPYKVHNIMFTPLSSHIYPLLKI